MLTDRAAELRAEAKSQDQYAQMLMRSGQQKERDWALWGGVADGIAGFGAGVSTAIDLQMLSMRLNWKELFYPEIMRKYYRIFYRFLFMRS